MDRDLEARMRAAERFHHLQLPEESWCIVRLDGRGFSRLGRTPFDDLFDPRLRDCLVAAAHALVEQLQALFACVQGDEISVLFGRRWRLFERGLEKILSISAGLASAECTRAAALSLHFDSRVWLGDSPAAVVDYFHWRQALGCRTALQRWQHRPGSDPGALPGWQRSGIGLVREQYRKTGWDPNRGQAVETLRRRVRLLEPLPTGEEYTRLVTALLADDHQQGQ